MLIRKQAQLLTFYSAGHFLVDLISAFLMISLTLSHPREGAFCLLAYNFCSFALQMPAGLVADRLDRNTAMAGAGLLLALFSLVLRPLPLLAAVTVGIGNCLYHVGGGVDVLHFSEKKQWMLGMYVSPGAIGLFLGGCLAREQTVSPLAVGLALLAAGLLLIGGLYKIHPFKRPSGNVPVDVTPVGSAPLLAFFSLFLVVALRSYAGLTQTFAWKSGTWVVLAVLGLALGKAMGGFLADRFGALPTAAVTLSASAVLYAFSEHAVCGLLAVLLFNMTMPLTLFAMAELFPGARGFAFGTLTFALFLGYLPTWLGLPVPFAGRGWWYAIQALLSLLLLTAGLLAGRKKGGDCHG